MTRLSDWWLKCSVLYGTDLLFLVTAVYSMQGMRAYTDTAVLFLFADEFKLPKTSSQQYVKAFARIPWNFKWLIGLVADTFPIAQRHARPYLFIAAVIGIVSVPLMGIKQITSTPISCAFALFGVQLYGAISDVLTDALVVRSGRQNEEEGSTSLQIWSWISFGVGGMIMTLLGGVFTEHHQTRLYMLLLSIMPILFTTVVCRLHEPKSALKVRGSIRSLLQQLARVILALLTPPYTVLKCSVWIFFSSASVIGMGDAVYLWKSEHIKISRQILAMGDAFSYLGLILGTTMYYKYFRKTHFRTIFCYTQLLVAVFSLTDIILIRRINLTIGIPDVAFVFAFDIVNEIISRLRLMPFLILSAQLCPKHIEATFFALLMSLSNLSSDAATLLGALIQDWYNIGPVQIANDDPGGNAPHRVGGSWEYLQWGIILRTIGTLLVLPVVLVVPYDLKTGSSASETLGEECGSIEDLHSVDGRMHRWVGFLTEFIQTDDPATLNLPLGQRWRRGEGADYLELSETGSLVTEREPQEPNEDYEVDALHSTAELIPKNH